MEKQSYISNRQLIAMLVMTRLSFSTAYLPGLNAGMSVQDVLPAVPVNFLLNFIFAVPILLLLRRHPGKDPVELTRNIIGRTAAVLITVFYMAGFLFQAFCYQSYFQEFYVNSLIPESSYLEIAVPILVVCFLGSVKGMETIARFGGLAFLIYLIVVILIDVSLLPSVDPQFLLPQFYKGPGIFLRTVLSGVNSNMQIVLLAFCAPYIKSGTGMGKIYARWNMITMGLFLLLEFFVVTVMGAYGARQVFPLYTLSLQSKIDVFERLDSVDVIAWILESVFVITFYVYLTTMCLTKIGINGRRRLVNLGVLLVLLAACGLLMKYNYLLKSVTFSPYVTAYTLLSQILLPLLLLTVDIVKERWVKQDEVGA